MMGEDSLLSAAVKHGVLWLQSFCKVVKFCVKGHIFPPLKNGMLSVPKPLASMCENICVHVHKSALLKSSTRGSSVSCLFLHAFVYWPHAHLFTTRASLACASVSV